MEVTIQPSTLAMRRAPRRVSLDATCFAGSSNGRAVAEPAPIHTGTRPAGNGFSSTSVKAKCFPAKDAWGSRSKRRSASTDSSIRS